MKGGMQDRMKKAVDRIIRTLGPRRLMRGMKGQHKTHLDQTYRTKLPSITHLSFKHKHRMNVLKYVALQPKGLTLKWGSRHVCVHFNKHGSESEYANYVI